MITPKRYEIWCRLVLVTRKSQIDFWLIPSSMTLNELKRDNSPCFAFFTEFDSFAGQLRHRLTVVDDRPIMSAKYCIPVPVFHFWPKVTHPAAQCLYGSWATCCGYTIKRATEISISDYRDNRNLLLYLTPIDQFVFYHVYCTSVPFIL